MKIVERLIIKYILKIIYGLSHIFRVKRRIVFATYRPDYMEGNYKYIIEELKRQDESFEIKVLYKKPEGGALGNIKYLLHMCKAEYYLATSEFFVVDDFYFPVYTINKLRKGTEVIQVWHACGAFKKFALSTVDESYSNGNEYIKYVKIHTNYTHVIVTSDEVKEAYEDAFIVDDKAIKPLGVARTDLFFDEVKKAKVKEELYKLYPNLEEKRVVLYAPTFRGTGQSNAESEITLDIEKLVGSFDDDTVLVLKMHPFVKWRYKGNDKRVIDMSNYKAINNILLITDTLITDYSSTIFEFALLERKMFFYADDLEEYINDRDFYYDFKDFVPGPIVKTTDELINAMNDEDYDLEKVKEFKNKFFKYTDGKSSERLVEKIILKK